MEETHFREFWYTTLKPNTPAELVAHWRDFELSGVARGREIVDIVGHFVDVRGASVLDTGCGYGGISIAFSLAGSKVWV